MGGYPELSVWDQCDHNVQAENFLRLESEDGRKKRQRERYCRRERVSRHKKEAVQSCWLRVAGTHKQGPEEYSQQGNGTSTLQP